MVPVELPTEWTAVPFQRTPDWHWKEVERGFRLAARDARQALERLDPGSLLFFGPSNPSWFFGDPALVRVIGLWNGRFGATRGRLIVLAHGILQEIPEAGYRRIFTVPGWGEAESFLDVQVRDDSPVKFISREKFRAKPIETGWRRYTLLSRLAQEVQYGDHGYFCSVERGWKEIQFYPYELGR
jgi:hypothetical protein